MKKKKNPWEQKITEVHIIIDNIALIIQVHGSLLCGAVLGSRRCLKETRRRGTAIVIKWEESFQLQCHELQLSLVIIITSPKHTFKMRKSPQIPVTCLGQLPPPTQEREAENVSSDVEVGSLDKHTEQLRGKGS